MHALYLYTLYIIKVHCSVFSAFYFYIVRITVFPPFVKLTRGELM